MENKQKQYPADTVDSTGTVFPTVGENIRNGVNGSSVPVIPGLTNIRLVTVSVDEDGFVAFSDKSIRYAVNFNYGENLASFTFESYQGLIYYPMPAPLMVWCKKRHTYEGTVPLYQLTIDENGAFGCINCPYDSNAVFYIADRVV